MRVGMLGFGTVGSTVFARLRPEEGEIVRIGVRDLSKPRQAPSVLFTDNLMSVVEDPAVDTLVEVMGGLDPAGPLVRRALELGKPVVTANKVLIGAEGPELFDLTRQNGVDLRFEAAVGAAIPVVSALRGVLRGGHWHEVQAVINGTTNFMLTQMATLGVTYEAILAEAQRLGYAEADPSADVDGHDAAAKIAILAMLALGYRPARVETEGIRGLTPEDFDWARSMGFQIRLLARASANRVSVAPTGLGASHPLAAIQGVQNAVRLRGDVGGDLLLAGPGAGGDATASAVIGDLLNLGRDPLPNPVGAAESLPADWESAFLLRLKVEDRPRMLGQVASRLGDFGVNVGTMEIRRQDALSTLVFQTHPTAEGRFFAAVEALRTLEGVASVESWLRIEVGD